MIDDFLLKALEREGIPPPPGEISSEKYTRWGKTKEFYAIKLSDGKGYYFGNFKSGQPGKAIFSSQRKFDKVDKKLVEKAKKQLKQDQLKMWESVATSCSFYWNNMQDLVSHEYLTTKKVKSYGLKQFMDKAVIPLKDIDGKIWSFQYISPKGEKHFRSKGRKTGCFFVLGDLKNSSAIYICEGYATAATLHSINHVPVVVAFDAGNLFSVTQAIRQKYPNAQITLCADNDAYGNKNTGVLYAQRAAKSLRAKVVIPQFKDTSTKPTDFNDLYVLEGEQAVIDQLDSKQITKRNLAVQEIEGFRITEDSLDYYDDKKQMWFKVCAPLKIVALTRELEEENAGRLVEFKDRQGKLKQVKIFDAWLSKDGSKIHDVLYKHGLDIGTEGKIKRKLNEFLNLINPPKTISYTIRSGWHSQSFLTAYKVYGGDEGDLIHLPAAEPAKLSTAGTLQEWQDNISALCINNSRLTLAVSAAFASMILTPCNADNFFLHFYGKSSQGKTTMLDVAASVFGDHNYTRTWRMTDNGLEGIAMAHNDLCLFLDEISECDPYKVGAMAYMLVNGSGKTRATTQGMARRVLRWTLGGISTGEERIADVIKSIGKSPKAGQLLRILSIPAIPEGGYGLFEDIHNFKNSAEFAISLKNAAKEYHGTAFSFFIERAIENYDNIRFFYNQEIEKACCDFLPKNASGQDIRAFKSFATCGVGGLLATKYGVTGWNYQDIMPLVMKNFDAWLDDKGGVGSQEDRQALTQIRIFFEKYGDIRFQYLAGEHPVSDRMPHERAGYRQSIGNETFYCCFKTYFEETIARGLDIKHVKNLLRNRGILETGKDCGRFDKQVRVEGKITRMYVINRKIFEGDD